MRKKQKKIRKIDEKIKKLKSDIRNLDKEKVANKNKLELKIENYQLEIDEINKSIPETWKSKNEEFQILHKAKQLEQKDIEKMLMKHTIHSIK